MFIIKFVYIKFMQKSAPIHKSGKFDEDYRPKQRSRKRTPLNKLPKRRNWKINKNKWSSKENNKYVEFLEQQIITSSPSWTNDNKRFYYRLGVFIKSRTTNQCRTHHRKMLKNYQTLSGIINHLKHKENAHSQINSQILQQNNNLEGSIENQGHSPEIQKQQVTNHTIQEQKKQQIQHSEQQEWVIIDQTVWIGK